ncbi:MAG TPA: ABC transporter permease [Blastocatellia bacterium]|nr:ABC transporter permease [Blastocatellia bacterium]
MQTLWQDVRYGARMLMKNPGFSLVAIVALALGIGANSAIFSVINAVLLRPLPFAEPERLVSVGNTDLKQGTNEFYLTWPDFADYRAMNQSFQTLAGFDERDVTLTGAGEAARLHGAMVTSDLFPMLGVGPQIGRAFTAEEEKPGTHVVLLSHGLWQRRFNADANVVGRAVGINGRSYTVAGVMPAGFAFPLGAEPVELWINAGVDGEGGAPLMKQRGNHYLEVLGRLKPGVTLAQAQAEIGRIAANLGQQYPDTNSAFGGIAVPFYQRVTGDARLALLVLLGAVGCVLLIACANVANLLLARASARRREIAIRAALGAGRGRVVRQLLTESVLLSLCGGVAGMMLALWGTEVLLAMVPKGLPRAAEASLDGRVLGFTLLISLLTGMLFGLAPAWQSLRTDLNDTLREGGRGGDGRGSRVRSALIVSEVAVAFLLLVCAGLLINSFWRLRQVNPGFDPKSVLSFRVSLPGTQYDKPEKVEAFYQQLSSRIQAMPGVVSVSGVNPLPLSGNNAGVGFAIEGQPTEPGRPFPYDTYLRVIRPDYFQTMNIQLVAGRDFSERDKLESTPVVIINESLAKRYFPNQNPLGRRINPSFGVDGRGVLWREIVGVVKDVHHASLSEDSDAEVYVAHTQAPWNTITVVARTSINPSSLIQSVRNEVRSLNPDLPVYDIRTLEERISLTVAQPRFQMLLLTIFAGIALLLTAVGLYGVLAYNVAQRTQEIGIRMALGASAGKVRVMVVRQGMTLALAGIGLGLIASFAATRLLASLLYGVTATDPLTFALIGLAMLLIALAACWIPARRATKVDPMIALRYE